MDASGATSLSAAPAGPRGPAAAASAMALIGEAISAAGGWLPFDRYMALALYAPGLGYYGRDRPIFGSLPASGSDYVTAPELTPLFGRVLARQLAQALDAADADRVVEFGAGSGALAGQLIGALDGRVRRYSITRPGIFCAKRE